MKDIKCPSCGKVFSLDDAGYAAIVKQIRDDEFSKEIENWKEQFEISKKQAVQLAITETESKLSAALNTKETELEKLRGVLKNKDQETALALASLKSSLEGELSAKEIEITKLNDARDRLVLEQRLNAEKAEASFKAVIDAKDREIEFYKNFKAKQSTKMIGESLEQYCSNLFNRNRSSAFRNAYFEKDNELSSNRSKGDFIYRDFTDDGVEFISIMFEMKNESDTTAQNQKHRNEEFYSKLDRDRRDKNCDYAVLVSMLEADNDIFNDGIYEVYQYEKMYVIRPQFFLPLISLLRNTSLDNATYKRDLAEERQKAIDVMHFEEKLDSFKEKFLTYYEAAGKKYTNAVESIDGIIKKLNALKEMLLDSEKNLKKASDKLDDLTIRSLTWGNPTMKARLEEAKASK